ncbi:TetR family transcriptional regulator [Caldovatus sediminis]|uniref:TetR family transcriptional regulator n=1 Tax=Caldovatus sediminis TaxID=2041189 RepID=A0A8J2Z838_9PROT|nr:TetR/AcrR family transcriptional regulator [Caldovatus sediminis]GGG21061.1 TetR family transcriptional regulator [Caldovatus sediminis]
MHPSAPPLAAAVPPPAADARTRILDAAEAIVQARGVPALTLEAAAREAGVSKGGLLYHFASKEALLAAMLARLSDWFRAEFETCVAAQAPGPGRIARAMLAWSLGEDEHACNERHERAAAVFLAVFHHDPGMLDPVRAVVAEIKRAVAADGLPEGHGHAIMAACDGLFFYRIFGLVRFDEAERAAMRAALGRLAAAPGGAAP